MSGARRALSALVGAIAVAMVGAAWYGLTTLDRGALGALSGLEVVLAASLVLPWFTVNAYRAAVRFSSEQAGASAWGALAAASVLLVLGQLAAFLPAALDLRGLETALVFPRDSSVPVAPQPGTPQPVAVAVDELDTAAIEVASVLGLEAARRP